MLFNLLNSTATNSGAGTGTTPSNPMSGFLMIGFFALLMVAYFIFARRSQKKREEESKKILDAIRPGHKVKTIGGICGTVVSVSGKDNTFVLETGEGDKKSYLTFDKYAVAQTDAMDKQEKKKEQKKEEKTEEMSSETRHSGADIA